MTAPNTARLRELLAKPETNPLTYFFWDRDLIDEARRVVPSLLATADAYAAALARAEAAERRAKAMEQAAKDMRLLCQRIARVKDAGKRLELADHAERIAREVGLIGNSIIRTAETKL